MKHIDQSFRSFEIWFCFSLHEVDCSMQSKREKINGRGVI